MCEAKIKNLKELKEGAIRHTSECKLRLATDSGEEVTISINAVMPKSFFYAANEAVFCDGEAIYVVPRTENVIVVLAAAGYKKNEELSTFYQEYSYLPDDSNQKQWHAMNNERLDYYKGFFAFIPESVLNVKCYKMPENGVTVECYDGITHYEPFEEALVGYYNIQNATLVFVYCDGTTYITTHVEELEKELLDKGYEKNEHMWVPFAHGDRPVKKTEKWFWDAMVNAG